MRKSEKNGKKGKVWLKLDIIRGGNKCIFLLKCMHHRIQRNNSTHIVTQNFHRFLWGMNVGNEDRFQ